MSLDEQRGIVFAPTGSATYDFYGGDRAGDNLFANTLLALDANTGKRIWHFQVVHHDLWDRDLPAPPSLVTVRRGGRSIDAVAQITKSGWVLVFDRQTGEPLYPIKERHVPASDIPGEASAATQPFVLSPEPFARQFLTEEMLTKRTPAAHQAALEKFRQLRSGGQFVPPSLQGSIILPGLDGGAEWGGATFDPETGLLYVNANEMAWWLKVAARKEPDTLMNGASIYQSECALCHGADRRGSPPQFPSLVEVIDYPNREGVITLITNGKGRMPPFARLGRAQIEAVSDFLLNKEEGAIVVQPGQSDAATEAESSDSKPIRPKYLLQGYKKFVDPDGYPAIAPPWGTLSAIDINSGQYRWRIPLGEYPELAAGGMKNTGSENYGGSVVTAGGLLFIGATVYDNKFRAFDKATGELLWEATLPNAGTATPAVYESAGRQFVVIATGSSKNEKDGKPGSSYVAFALPRTAAR